LETDSWDVGLAEAGAMTPLTGTPGWLARLCDDLGASRQCVKTTSTTARGRGLV
jgi:hypothetical protein